MFDAAVKSELREALDAYGLKPNQKLGQNFLCDGQMADAIIATAGLLGDKTVLEIGPGAGVLTGRLTQKAKKVVAVELDAGLFRLLSERMIFDNLQLVHGDALKIDLGALIGEGPCAVIANLPYYITSAILMRLLPLPQVETMILMMQKEVAQRLAAQPGGKDYGSLTLAVKYHAEAELLRLVPPECFFPIPKVDSAVLRLTKRPYDHKPKDEDKLFQIIRLAFAMRRKTLLNNLAANMGREKAAEAIERAGLSPMARAETLSLEEFIRLSDQI